MTSSGSEPVSGQQTEKTLDPIVLERCRDLVGLLFPWDMNRALELALLKTFCLPSISGNVQVISEDLESHVLDHWGWAHYWSRRSVG